ncbi:hypothetical protein HNQ60_005210 [Povalibacter uvarum]|uniref:Uncharacterized protein n=1 Tax=Povalibacter uvarum TaxID=732238 RepID=A0A841HWJ8_9GAMM|nr:hypothetical protein [Povalibacter uvarum]MBB6096288.1 hypothetical protein [Povalibacter uvarum]
MRSTTFVVGVTVTSECTSTAGSRTLTMRCSAGTPYKVILTSGHTLAESSVEFSGRGDGIPQTLTIGIDDPAVATISALIYY